MKGKTIQSLEGDTEYLHNIGVGKDFLNRTQKVLKTREKMDKLDEIKIKSVCASNDTTESGGGGQGTEGK